MSDQTLQATLLDFHSRLTKNGLDIILGGGFGLYLKQLNLMSSESTVRTLLPTEAWPRPRSTADLDVFVPQEVLISLSDMQNIRSIIDEMKFEAIVSSKYYQFVMPSNQVKLDLLNGPIEESAKSGLQVDQRRVRPKGDLQLHTHPVPEALDLSKDLEEVPVVGTLPSGEKYTAMIKIPSPFTYLMMKVTAFGDQLENVNKSLGSHHALDVYRIIAMLSEQRFNETKQQFAKHVTSPNVENVKELAAKHFSHSGAKGILHMKEHALFGENMLVSNYIDNLKEIMHSK